MASAGSIFGVVARNGRLVLILGLVAGIALPALADMLKPWIGEMVAGLLFLAALRVGPKQAFGALGDIGLTIGRVGLFQIVFPLIAILASWVAGASGLLVTGLVMMLAASPISGSPNITIMTGNDPAPSLRQLVIGTALLPLTVIPVFWFVPEFGSPAAVVGASAGLLLLIAGAGGAAFLLRGTVIKDPSPDAFAIMDGVSAIALAVVVVALMSAVGPAMIETPGLFLATLATACAANFALQFVVALAAARYGERSHAAAIGIVAGNRNIALFLTVLPPAIIDPLLLFVGCYQIPMYLTPAVMGRFYARLAAASTQSK